MVKRMDKLITITSVAAPMPRADIDTDLIYPARFLLLIDRAKVGAHLFHDLRRAQRPDRPSQGPGFVLDKAPYDQAKILVVGPGFGTGSSREHAVWALVDNGIRAVIATSLGEIFQSNCVENGLVPIIIEHTPWRRLMEVASSGATMTIDLQLQRISFGDDGGFDFELDPASRRKLMLGVDTIDEVLGDAERDIAAFEKRQRSESPWLQLQAPDPLITPRLS